MEDLIKKLIELKDMLEKGMNNAGLGGTGSVKAGAVLPSISKLPKPGNNSLAGKMKIPNVAPVSQKNPIKSIEQTQNKDIKDLKMKEAQAQLGKKPEKITIQKNGQWNLEDVEKSNYIGYDHADNTKRKANNLTESTGHQNMPRVKQYGNTAKDQASREAAEMKAKSKKNPVKVYTPEEIAALNAKKD